MILKQELHRLRRRLMNLGKAERSLRIRLVKGSGPGALFVLRSFIISVISVAEFSRGDSVGWKEERNL